MFMTTVFLTNAVVLGAKTMEGNMYLNIISLFSVEIVACFTSGLIINWPPMGRKKGLILFYFGVIVGFVFFVLFQNFGFNEYWQLGAMAIIRSAITSVFTTFYIYIMENYPTPIRSLGFGLNSALGNVMGIASPIIIEYFSATILYIIFGILCTINCLLTFFLKETVGQPMQETIEELNEEDVDKERLIPKNDDGEKGEEGENEKKKEDKKEEKDIETKKDEETKEEKKNDEKKEEKAKEEENEDDKKEDAEKPLLDNNENADAINEPDGEN